MHKQAACAYTLRSVLGVKSRFVLLRILCQEHTYLQYIFRCNVKHDLAERTPLQRREGAPCASLESYYLRGSLHGNGFWMKIKPSIDRNTGASGISLESVLKSIKRTSTPVRGIRSACGGVDSFHDLITGRASLSIYANPSISLIPHFRYENAR